LALRARRDEDRISGKADAPEVFDVLVSEEGQMPYVTDRPRKAHLPIVAHTPQKHLNTRAASDLFRITHSYVIGFE
jgi:hypothetical protein